MPYQTARQSRYIHAKASEGVGWAKRFVKDSHGTHVVRKKRRRVKRAYR